MTRKKKEAIATTRLNVYVSEELNRTEKSRSDAELERSQLVGVVVVKQAVKKDKCHSL